MAESKTESYLRHIHAELIKLNEKFKLPEQSVVTYMIESSDKELNGQILAVFDGGYTAAEGALIIEFSGNWIVYNAKEDAPIRWNGGANLTDPYTVKDPETEIFGIIEIERRVAADLAGTLR